MQSLTHSRRKPQPSLTGNRCRCTDCGEYFNRSSTFTAHRVGPYAPINRPDTRRSLSYTEMVAKGWCQNQAGFWTTAKPAIPRRRIGIPAAIAVTPYAIGAV